MAEHEHGGLQQRGGVGDVFAGDVGGGAVDGFEDGALDAEVGAGDEAEAADEAGAEIADDVAVEIFKQQRVVLEGVHDELHAGVVDDVLAVEDVRETPRRPCGRSAGRARRRAS